jgi:hypothetical protein
MTTHAPSSTSFLYIECDIPAEQTLLEWRRERDAAREAARRPRRSLRGLWPARWTA